MAKEVVQEKLVGCNEMSFFIGIVISGIIAIIAYMLGNRYEIIGAPVFAIIIGIAYSNLWGVKIEYMAGVGFAAKKILQWSIVVLGASLSFGQVWQTGKQSIVVMLVTLTVAIVTAYLAGKLFRISGKLTSLIGVGTAICGGSAIAAISPIVEADDEEMAYAISTIFLFNVMAAVLFPLLGHLLSMSSDAFGLWAGTAINDTSSVVAAGYSYSKSAGDYATIVKLARTTMIIPAAVIFSIGMNKRRKGSGSSVSWNKVFPFFIIGFILASLLNTMGIIPEAYAIKAHGLGKFMITIALAAVGLKTDFRKIITTGVKPLFLGLIVWASVAVTSLLVQMISGQI